MCKGVTVRGSHQETVTVGRDSEDGETDGQWMVKQIQGRWGKKGTGLEE